PRPVHHLAHDPAGVQGSAGVLAAGCSAAPGGQRRVLIPGRSASPTPLRCSRAGRAAQLASLTFGSLRSNRRGEREGVARVPAARTLAPRTALLAAPQIARAAGHPPRRGDVPGLRATSERS